MQQKFLLLGKLKGNNMKSQKTMSQLCDIQHHAFSELHASAK